MCISKINIFLVLIQLQTPMSINLLHVFSGFGGGRGVYRREVTVEL